MPDHFHLIITPENITLERTLQLIKGGFSHRVRQVRPNLNVWQKSFTDHRIRDAVDYSKHREYLLSNPVRARLSQQPELYPYSSANPLHQTNDVPQRLKPISIAAERHG